MYDAIKVDYSRDVPRDYQENKFIFYIRCDDKPLYRGKVGRYLTIETDLEENPLEARHSQENLVDEYRPYEHVKVDEAFINRAYRQEVSSAMRLLAKLQEAVDFVFYGDE